MKTFLSLGISFFCLFFITTTAAHGQAVAAPIGEPAAKKEDILEYADLLYSQKQYGLAARQYQLFLEGYPKSPNIQAGWFRLGECYLQVDQKKDAEATFNHIVATFKNGVFVGSAAFRLAVLRYNAADYQGALPFFEIAAKEIKDDDVKLRALFYLGQNYKVVKNREKAAATFEKVLSMKEKPADNPFYEEALLETARIAADNGENETAYNKFQTLAKTAKKPANRAESLARGGLIAGTLGKQAESTQMLDELIKMKEDSEWKSYAKVGLIFNYFGAEEYEKVISTYETGSYDGPADQKAKMLLIVAHSYRLTDNFDPALNVYKTVQENFRNSPEGTEAAYSRLQILHAKGDGGMPVFAADFVEKQREIDPEVSYIDKALLMKAEYHFTAAQEAAARNDAETTKAEYKAAGEAYAKIRDDKVDEKFHEPRLYKQGWSEIESGNISAGVITLSKFLEEYPKSKLASSALAKRAATHQENQDFASALADFKELVRGYPGAGELEYAMQQVALLHGQRRELKEMVAAYRALLEKFPETSGAAEAHYWIGVGNFDSENFEEAITSLKKARELNPKQFAAKASLRIVLAYYQMDDIPPLKEETAAYLKLVEEAQKTPEEAQPAKLPTQVLTHLGLKLYDIQDYEGTDKFLTAAATPSEPGETEAGVWRRLGESRAKLDKHAGVVEAFDFYLQQVEKPSQQGTAWLAKGKAFLGMKKFEEARNAAREVLRKQKQGRTNAEARLLLGDIAFSEEKFADAAREYVVLSQIFIDNEIAPLSLHKAALAYDKAGDSENAAKTRAELKQQFPDFKPPADA